MKTWINRLLFAIQFMTRIPIKKEVDISKEDMPHIAACFPIVGILVGVFSAILCCLGIYWGSSGIAAVFAVIGSVLITGALHVDGLGDMFDALGSAKDKTKMLEIMKDSRMGTMGVVAVVLDLGLKLILFYEIIAALDYNALFYVALVPIIGRLSICAGTTVSKCARPGGMGSWFIDGMKRTDFFLCYAITIVLALVSLPIPTALMVCVYPPLAAIIAARLVSKKLDGITGDTMGMFCEIGEAVCLIVMVMKLA